MKKLIIYITLLLLINACQSKQEEISQEPTETGMVTLTKQQVASAGIIAGHSEEKELKGNIKASGKLDVPPQNLVTISAVMGGYVKKTDLLQGMRVKKGEVLFTIENPEFIQLQRTYLETKSKLKYLELEYERQETLYNQNIAAAQAYQEAQANYLTAKAQIADLQARLKMIGIDADKVSAENLSSTAIIRSPENGFVSTLNVNIGKYVGPQDVLCEIINTAHLHVELYIYEKDIDKIKEGQPISFHLMNNDSKEYKASVFLIQRTIQADRTIRIHGHLVKDDPTLLPNMYVQGNIIVASTKVQALPQDAIVQMDGKSVVFIESKKEADNIIYEPVEVRTGLSSEGWTEVHLPEKYTGVPIVTKGAFTLLSVMLNSEEEE
ncbi:MAG: efflux RND transporter periplasmic adaptor subunit [Cytophagaceae bacterium]